MGDIVLFRQRKPKVYKPRKDIFNNYKELFRFQEDNVKWIANHFLKNEETRGGALSSKKRMEIFLRYMSDPGFQVGVGEDVGVNKGTVSRNIKLVLHAYDKLCQICY